MSQSMRNSHNHGLATYDLKPSPRNNEENDVTRRVTGLYDYLNQTKQELKDYKKLIETYRSEIASMQRNLETLNNENLKQLVPTIQHDTDYFNAEMQKQRQENIHLQARLTELKKDKA